MSTKTLVRALTSTLVVLITFTTSPTYEPGSCSSASSSRSSRTALFQETAKINHPVFELAFCVELVALRL